MYKLNLNTESRILSATFAKYMPDGVLTENLPKGDISDYKYIDGQFVYDPLPKPKELKPQPSLQEQIDQLKKAIFNDI